MNLHEAETHRSRRVERAANGEEVTISNAGRPRARSVADEHRPAPRKPGSRRGEVWIADDVDDTPDDILHAFEGRS